ncbi:MAG TPA: CoA transferase [Lacipirellulaceae bacterium]|nr:CoA transferase [Lacipirellulaceae bacterium]
MDGGLEGIVVIDLTTFLSGPYCTMLLGDAGAEIIKIERPDGGDEMRRIAPFIGDESAAFMLLNRNKRSLCLDLKTDEGIAAARRIIETADVLVENFRPGVCDKLGLGYAAMSKLNPRLVYCSISGFGGTGPYRDRGGFDLIAQSMSGLMAINADDSGNPRRLPVPISDICAGMFGSIGVLTALQARHRTGRGQHVDLSLFETALSLGVYESASYFATGERPKALGEKHRGSAPYQAFQASDGWLVVGAGPQNLWEKFCDILDAPELARDPRFVDNPARVRNSHVLATLIQGRMIKENRSHWLAALEAVGIPAGPVLHHDETYADPQVQAREMIQQIKHPTAGVLNLLGSVSKLSDTPNAIRRPAPLLGQHSREILTQYGLRQSAAE